MASGEDWIYVLSHDEEAVHDAEVELAVTATTATAAVVEENNNNTPSKNPDDDGETAAALTEKEEENNDGDDDDDDEASAQPSESDNKQAPPQPSPKDGGGGAAKCTWDDEDADYPEYYTEQEIQVEKAYQAYIAALNRAFKIDAAAAAAGSNSTGGGRGGRAVMENHNHPAYDDDRYGSDDDDTYGAEPPYYRGYDYAGEYYRRYGFVLPGAAYGAAATGSGYGYGGGYYYGEPAPYAYQYVPGYRTSSYELAAPLAAFNAAASFYTLPPTPMPYVSYRPGPAPGAAPVPTRRPGDSGFRYSEPAAVPAVAPTTQPPQPSQHYY